MLFRSYAKNKVILYFFIWILFRINIEYRFIETKQFLREHPDILVTSADKLKVTVLMLKLDYDAKMKVLLDERSTYTPFWIMTQQRKLKDVDIETNELHLIRRSYETHKVQLNLFKNLWKTERTTRTTHRFVRHLLAK